MRRVIIQTLSLIPFFRIVLKFLYQFAIKKLNILAIESQDIIDILLISNMKEHDFVYGSSDLNLIIVIKDHVYPKDFLIFLRKELINIWPANMLVDIKNLNVLKESELKTPLIRSTMLARFENNQVSWPSIIDKTSLSFHLKEQDHHNIQYHYVKQIEKMLLNPKKDILINRHWIRSFGKKMYFSLKGLSKYNLINPADDNWLKSSAKLMRYTFFSRSKYRQLKIQALNAINNENIELKKYEDSPEGYREELLHFCSTLIDFPIVEDIVLNPALIQLDSSNIKGKIFIDIILGTKDKKFSIELLHSLQEGIDHFLGELDEAHPKYVFQFSTLVLIKAKCEQVLFNYPLEYQYRIERSYSIQGNKYKFEPNTKQLEKACIQFLLHEFMKFRTLKHKNKLIGSRFIKSLNVIYRYQLLLNFLKGQEFAVSHSYQSIMEELTPQLTHIKPNEKVDAETWKIIKAQMLYILKRVRDELSKKNPSLKNLQF